MDSRTAKVDVEALIAQIKGKMPCTYKRIQLEAAAVGNAAYTLVRQGLRGEPNCFYAIEAGYVVGTPFSVSGIQDRVAGLMVQFGASFVCIFPVQDPDAAQVVP